MSQLELINGVRKPMPKPSRVVSKFGYDRNDKSWRKHE